MVKEVGQALKNYRYKSHKHGLEVPCIGICTWEYTAGTEQLENPITESPLTYNIDMDMVRESIRFSRRSRTVMGSVRFGSKLFRFGSVRFETKYSNVYRKTFYNDLSKTISCVQFLALTIKRALIGRTKNRTHVQGCTINKLN